MNYRYEKSNRTWRGKARAFLLLGVTALLALAGPSPTAAQVARAMPSAITDAAGDAAFPMDLYDGPVPPYLDIVAASVGYARGTFHFEIKMSAQIPANADPGLAPSVNHLGSTFGLLTDPATAQYPVHSFGQKGNYKFNYYAGALYSVADSGIGLGLGWHGFLVDLSTFTAVEVPLQIKKDTLILEISAASIGNPASFDWVVASECDPVPITQEDRKKILMVDFAPDHGYANWQAQAQ